MIAGSAVLSLGAGAQEARPIERNPQHSDSITVTATRSATRLADTPTSTVVLSRATLSASAPAVIDDVLRQVPGFTLFRRSGSRTANPTTQGVSLRGIGASGASRALVLDDGVPVNDPFGGWVYWGRIPRASLERVEVLRGGASDLYGSGAMSGVVQFIRRSPSQPAISVDVSGGGEATATSSFHAASGGHRWRGSVGGDLFTTGGYVLVEPASRGVVDTRAGSRHTALEGTLERSAGAGRAFLKGSRYREARGNGTPQQVNDTTARQVAIGMDTMIARGSAQLRGFASDQDYFQTFSAIAADRASERLTVRQQVPSRSAGGSLQWAGAFGRRNAVVTGVEARQVSGASEEEQFSPARTTFTRSSGRQRSMGAFVQDVLQASDRLSVTAGLRLDGWRNFDAARDATALAGRSDESWSPRLSLFYRASDRVDLVATAYRAFRAPTLNELYRGFRVGNVLTLANEFLGPERLSAVEAGVRAGAVRLTVFSMRVEDTVANVTLSSTPALITRRRQNLGQTRTRGIELESERQLTPLLRASAGYLYSDAIVTSGALKGRRLPQVPRHQASLQLTLTTSLTTGGIQMRWSAAQFDDDLNQLRLNGYSAVDAIASRTLRHGFALTFAVENLFDQRAEVSATPVLTLGAPRSARVGVRYSR